MIHYNFHAKVIITCTVLVATLFCFFQPAEATISRVGSLGGGGDFFEDDSNVLRWYGSLTDYPNEAVLESGNFTLEKGYWHSATERNSGPGFGTHFSLGQNGRFGTAAFFYHGQDEDRTTALQKDHLRNNLSFLYAQDFGSVSAAITYRHGSLTTDEHDSTRELSIDTFGTGVRLDLSPSAYLDVAGEIRRVHEVRNWDPDFQENDDDGLYALRARAFTALSPRLALVPLAEYIHEDRQSDGFPVARTVNYRLKRAGLGLNFYPDTDHLLLLSAEYSNHQDTEDWSVFILQGGFEARMFSWLTTRGSIGWVNYQLDTEINPGAIADDDNDPEEPLLRVNLGASIHLGPADLDIAFWEKAPMVTAIAGNPTINDPGFRWVSITARYLF